MKFVRTLDPEGSGDKADRSDAGSQTEVILRRPVRGGVMSAQVLVSVPQNLLSALQTALNLLLLLLSAGLDQHSRLENDHINTSYLKKVFVFRFLYFCTVNMS